MFKHQFNNHNFKAKFYSDIVPFVYNIGAAIVIFGAMFKLLNLPGGSIMLGVGLSTEACIFISSAFEPKEEVVETPTITQKLDQWLGQASIDADLLESLAANMRRFSENIATLPSFTKVTQATEAYVAHLGQATQVIGGITKANDTITHVLSSFTTLAPQDKLTNYLTQIEEVAHTLNSMNQIYKKTLADIQNKTTCTTALHNHLDTTLQAMETAGNEALNFKQGLALLNEKVTALGEIYAKTLTAFKG